jgi:hypothetical protein
VLLLLLLRLRTQSLLVISCLRCIVLASHAWGIAAAAPAVGNWSMC